MKRSLLISALLLASAPGLLGQTVAKQEVTGAYLVPFDKKGNRIELAVSNGTAESYGDVEVRAVDVPAWLTLEPSAAPMEGLGVKEEAVARFMFSTDDSAPTEELTALTFEVYSGEELLATKQIDISVELPKELVLRGNYPNPFNPSTTIGFVQPQDGDIELQIFDAAGRRVDFLRKPSSKRGQQALRWNASSKASGVYFYRLSLKSDGGAFETRLGKMLLVK